MSPQSARRVLSRHESRCARVRLVVEHMNRCEGFGWARRMEVRDHYMDQDYPTLWLSGRKWPLDRNVRKLEAYARRFGFVPADVAPEPFARKVTAALDLYATS